MKICVFPFSRRKGFECKMRSRSRWNGVRTLHSYSSCGRPAVSYERTASGKSAGSPCSRMRAAKASATLPATSGTRATVAAVSDDDRDGSTVDRPRCAGDVRGPFGQQEHDHVGDLAGLGETAERPAGGDLR